MAILYFFSILAIIQGLGSLIDGFRASRHMRTFRPRRVTRGRVVVFCPCKGIEADFEQNVRSLLDQDYPNYTVQFIVESRDDPAYGLLSEIGTSDVLVAGRASTRGQKVHNLAFAISQFTQPPDIYVFADSDARYPARWLSSLVAGLHRGDEECVTTGYRWYLAERFHIPTLLRSAWNASILSMLGDHDRNFAWGGSTAMRRETFDRLGILEAWEGSVSDDYAVTRAAQRACVPIVFVPECLVPSYGSCTWRELLEFTTRQVIITRIYHSKLWWVGFATVIIFSTAFYGMLFVQPGISAAVFVLAALKSAIRLADVQSVAPGPNLLKFSWFYILSTPFVAPVFFYNMVRSALGTDIVWRQIRYRLVSPNKTHVLERPGN